MQEKVLVCQNPECGKEFTTMQNAQKYCCPKCRRRVEYLVKEKIHRKAVKVRKFTCAYCGKDFLSDRKKKYCCDTCRRRASGRLKYVPRSVREPSNKLSLEEIAKLSREEGLSYGEYVIKYDL